jgi:hypothetical protein
VEEDQGGLVGVMALGGLARLHWVKGPALRVWEMVQAPVAVSLVTAFLVIVSLAIAFLVMAVLVMLMTRATPVLLLRG